MQERINAAKAARQLALQCQSAVFSTLSHKLQGAPFGSVSTVMQTDTGDVIFYVSDIAQHARNLEHDNRLSITLYHQASAGDRHAKLRPKVVQPRQSPASQSFHTGCSPRLAMLAATCRAER